jgi:hypothetical protein
VLNGRWIQHQMKVNPAHPRHRPERYADLRHWILLFKETTAECAGTSLEVHRYEGELKVVEVD